MNRNFRLLFLLPAVVSLAGCHGVVGGRTSEEQQALDKVSIQSALESDRAGVIFAQKTLDLDEKRAAAQAGAGAQDAQARIARSKADLYVAETMYGLTQERQKIFSEYMAWKTFAKTPIMSDAAKSPD